MSLQDNVSSKKTNKHPTGRETEATQLRNSNELVTTTFSETCAPNDQTNSCGTCGFAYQDSNTSLETRRGMTQEHFNEHSSSVDQERKKVIAQVGKMLAQIGDALWEKRRLKH